MEDIAQNKTPNTQNDMLTAERNLELRMQQPSYFDYPTPRQEAFPSMPQVCLEIKTQDNRGIQLFFYFSIKIYVVGTH